MRFDPHICTILCQYSRRPCIASKQVRFVYDLVSISQIVKLSDGIMVARGDLGVEMSPWDVPIIQKQIVQRCRALGKPVVHYKTLFSCYWR